MSPVPAREEALKAEQTKADETNKSRTGKGLRMRVGQTRGKNPSVISWEAFDESKPDTLPTNLKEFVDITKASDTEALEYLITGYNSAAYAQASDEIGEFINDEWDKDTQAQFRLAVRNFSKLSGQSIEQVVNMLKPATESAFQAKKAAAAQPTA